MFIRKKLASINYIIRQGKIVNSASEILNLQHSRSRTRHDMTYPLSLLRECSNYGQIARRKIWAVLDMKTI